MDKEKRKALTDAYKNRTVVGGVYGVRCSGNNKLWLRSTTDMKGARNRVMFSLRMNGAPEPLMRRECTEYGAESFSFVVFEELEKGETQTDSEFSDDIAALFEIWQEKYDRGEISPADGK